MWCRQGLALSLQRLLGFNLRLTSLTVQIVSLQLDSTSEINLLFLRKLCRTFLFHYGYLSHNIGISDSKGRRPGSLFDLQIRQTNDVLLTAPGRIYTTDTGHRHKSVCALATAHLAEIHVIMVRLCDITLFTGPGN